MIRSVSLRAAIVKNKFTRHVHRSSLSLLSYKTSSLVVQVDNGIFHYVTLRSGFYDYSRIISIQSSIMVGVPNPYSLRSSVSTSDNIRENISLFSRTTKKSFEEISLRSSRNQSDIGVLSLRSTQVIASRPEIMFSSETSKMTFVQHTLKSTVVKSSYQSLISLSLHSTTILLDKHFNRRFVALSQPIEMSSTFSAFGESVGPGFLVAMPVDLEVNSIRFNDSVSMEVAYEHIPLPFFRELLTPTSRLKTLEIITLDAVYIEEIDFRWVEGVLYPASFNLILSIEKDIKDMEILAGDKFRLPIVNTSIMINKPTLLLDLTANHTAFKVGYADFGLILGIIQALKKPEDEFLEVSRYNDLASFPAQRLPVTISRYRDILEGIVVTNETNLGSLTIWRFNNINLDIPPSQQDIGIRNTNSVLFASHPPIIDTSLINTGAVREMGQEAEALELLGSKRTLSNNNNVVGVAGDTLNINEIPDYFFHLMSVDPVEKTTYPQESFTYLVDNNGTITEVTSSKPISPLTQSIYTYGTFYSKGIQDLTESLYMGVRYNGRAGSFELLDDIASGLRMHLTSSLIEVLINDEPEFPIEIKSTQLIDINAMFTVSSKLEVNQFSTFESLEFEIELRGF